MPANFLLLYFLSLNFHMFPAGTVFQAQPLHLETPCSCVPGSATELQQSPLQLSGI